MTVDNQKNCESNSNALKCLYSSIGANQFSGCSSIINLKWKNFTENILVYGADCSIALAKQIDSLSAKFCLHQTIFGHKGSIRVLKWIRSLVKNDKSSLVFLVSVDCTGLVILWSFEIEQLIHLNENSSNPVYSMLKQFELPIGSNITSVDGYYFAKDLSNTNFHLVLNVSYNFTILTLSTDLLTKSLPNLPSSLTQCGLIECKPALCLCLANVALQINSFQIHLVCLGLDNGQLEIWSGQMIGNEEELVYTKAVCLFGHQDWLRCVDLCLDLDTQSVMIATGGQDHFIRIWRLWLSEPKINSDMSNVSILI